MKHSDSLDVAIDFTATYLVPRIAALDMIEVEFIPYENHAFRASASMMKGMNRCQIRVSSGVLYALLNLKRQFPISLRRQLRDTLQTAFADSKPGADTITILGISFVLMHELAHAALGHIEFFQSTGRRYSSQIGDTQYGQGQTDAFTKIRELEADGTAIYMLYQMLFRFANYIKKRNSKLSTSRSSPRSKQRAMRQILLFSALLATFPFDNDRMTSKKPGHTEFSIPRMVGVIIAFVQTAKPRSVRFDKVTKTLYCKPERQESVLRFIVKDILPVLRWCQFAVNVASLDVNMVAIDQNSSSELLVVRDIISIVMGGAALSQGALEIHALGPSLETWYGEIQAWRKDKHL